MKIVRIILIASTIFAFGFSVASLSLYVVRDVAEREAYEQEQEEARANGKMVIYGQYCFPDRHPAFLLSITVLIGISLLLLFIVKNSIWSLPFSLASFLMYPYWYWWTRQAISLAESVVLEGVDLYLYKANGFDLAVFSLLSLIILIQFTLLAHKTFSFFKHSRSLP